MKKHFHYLIILLVLGKAYAQPYWGTSWIDSTIISMSDPSSLVSVTYTGQGFRTVYDRRISDWTTINAYLFNIIWDDGLTCEAQINPEFGSVLAATTEANKYGYIVGKLPNCVRTNVDALWIHQGTELFGGGNHSILIHTGQSILYEADGFLEEVLLHEAAHSSLDSAHLLNPAWVSAQNGDGIFISNYAATNPTTEDISESFPAWLAVRQCNLRISQQDYDTITQTIPNRITYLDNQNFNTYPVCINHVSINSYTLNDLLIFPNPTDGVVNLSLQLEHLDKHEIKITDITGKIISNSYLIENQNYLIDASSWKKGTYWVILESCKNKRTYKLIVK